MRVACIGNMNNMLFSLVRYLRDRGVDADLLYQPELPHFHPSHDTFDLSYRNYTRIVDWPELLAADPSDIAKDLAPYDFLIVTGIFLAHVHQAKRRADVFFPHGSDLVKWPFFRDTLRWDQRVRRRDLIAFFDSHRAGISDSLVINQESGSSEWRSALERLGVLDRTVYFGSPMIYIPLYSEHDLSGLRQRSAWHREFARVRENSQLMVMNHNCQEWTGRSDRTKGVDRLIRGFAQVVKRRPDLRAVLVMFEVGSDVGASKRLVRDLGIEANVEWFPLMPRKEVMLGLLEADIGCGGIDTGAIGGGTTWEVLAAGRPLLHYIDTAAVNLSPFTEVYPGINVKEPEDIAAALEDAAQDPSAYARLGEQGRRWFTTNMVGRSVDTYLALIDAKNRGQDLLSVAKEVVASRNAQRTATVPGGAMAGTHRS